MADMELVWEFANDGVWTRYDDDVQEKIRQAKEAKLPQVEVSPCHMLDFAQCRQFHKHDSSKWRGVQMVQVPHERLALLDVSSRASPGRITPDHCDQGLFETTMRACSNAWRCFAGEALVQKAEELQVPGPLTLLQEERVLQDDKAMPVAEALGSLRFGGVGVGVQGGRARLAALSCTSQRKYQQGLSCRPASS